MGRRTRVITLSALFSALAVISLFFAALWPSGELALAAFASMFVAAAIIEEGVAAGLYVFVCSAALGLILFPAMPSPLFYAAFFGYYPILKCLVERLRQKPLQWILKLVFLNAALAAMFFFMKSIVFDFGDYSPGISIVCVVGSAIFILFDYGFSKAIRLYKYRVHGRFGHRR